MTHLPDRTLDPVSQLELSRLGATFHTHPSHLVKRVVTSMRRIWIRLRHADTSTVMLILALLMALLVMFGLTFTSVNRRH